MPDFRIALGRDRMHTGDLVYRQIKARPGIHQAAIASELGVQWSTVNYHVNRLERKMRINTVEINGKRALYPANLPTELQEVWAAFHGPRARDVLDFLTHNSGVGLADLARHFGLTRKKLVPDLRRLVKAGLIERIGGHRGQYTLTDSGRAWLERSPHR